MSKYIYHYTSLESFLKIAEHLTIRLSNAKFMNDGNELEYGKQLFLKLLSEREDLVPKDITQVQSLFSENLVEGPETYAFCLTSLRDAFTQWRLYGDDGRGVAIGFDREILKQIDDSAVNDVSYCATNQAERLKHHVDRINAKSLTDMWLMIQGHIEPMIATFKQAEFATETETRVLSRVVDIDAIDMTREGGSTTCEAYHDQVNYFPRGGMIVPYIEKVIPRESIQEIVIGPRACVGHNIAAFKAWMRSKGFADFPVIASKIRYQA